MTVERHGKNFQRALVIWRGPGFGGRNVFKIILYLYDISLKIIKEKAVYLGLLVYYMHQEKLMPVIIRIM